MVKVKNDKEETPINLRGIIPLGYDNAKTQWPDHSDCNDADWAAKHLKEFDMEKWSEGALD